MSECTKGNAIKSSHRFYGSECECDCGCFWAVLGAANDSGWLWVVVSGPGWSWVVLGDPGWPCLFSDATADGLLDACGPWFSCVHWFELAALCCVTAFVA